MIITYDLLRAANFAEGPAHVFSGEASSLGLAPGDFPLQIEASVGNGLPLIRSNSKYEDGDLLLVKYSQSNGIITIIIFND